MIIHICALYIPNVFVYIHITVTCYKVIDV